MKNRKGLRLFTLTLVATALITTIQALGGLQVTAAAQSHVVAPNCFDKCRKICASQSTDPHKWIPCENDCIARCTKHEGGDSGTGGHAGPPAYDLVSGVQDGNGLLLNPVWAGQVAKYPDLGSGFYNCFHNLDYSRGSGSLGVDPACTKQVLSIDQANDALHNPICSGETSPVGFNGHINWFNVTYEGDVTWDDHDQSDNEFNFNMSPDPEVGEGVPIGAFFFCTHAGDWTDDVVSRCGPHWQNGEVQKSLHLEMKSDETIDNFEGAWWQLLHNHHDDLTYGLGKGTKLGFGIATGLFGTDCEHDCHIEIHPILAMAIRTSDWVGFSAWGGSASQNPPNSETWEIFVRSSGSEGYCSAGNNTDHGWKFSSYMFRLPWKPPPATIQQWQGVRVLSSEFWDHDRHHVSPPAVAVLPGIGVVVRFPTLPQPGGDRVIDGELSLQYISPNMPDQNADLTIDNITNRKSEVFQSRTGSVIIRHKIDDHSDVRIIAAKDVWIGEKIDQHSKVEIIAGGHVYIGQKIDQHSVAIITAQNGDVSIGQKIDQHSWARISVPNGSLTIGQGVDQHSHLHFQAKPSSSTGPVENGSSADGDMNAGFDPKESGPDS